MSAIAWVCSIVQSRFQYRAPLKIHRERAPFLWVPLVACAILVQNLIEHVTHVWQSETILGKTKL
eukprot:scaffold8369_cov121-Cylindrotheca_fusiformis.AAC.6